MSVIQAITEAAKCRFWQKWNAKTRMPKNTTTHGQEKQKTSKTITQLCTWTTFKNGRVYTAKRVMRCRPQPTQMGEKQIKKDTLWWKRIGYCYIILFSETILLWSPHIISMMDRMCLIWKAYCFITCGRCRVQASAPQGTIVNNIDLYTWHFLWLLHGESCTNGCAADRQFMMP